MRKTIPKTFRKILQRKDATMQQILTHQQHIEALQIKIKSIIDKDLSDNCRLANIRGQRLFFHCNNAAWANRLRFAVPALQQQLQRRYQLEYQVGGIQIRLQEPLFRQRQASRPPLSDVTRAFLEGTAKSLSDRRLAAAFARLAQVKAKEKAD